MNKEHPILFNAEMVKAILGGTKTMTRRVIVPQPPYHPNIQEPLFKKCILHGIKGKLEYWLDEHTGKTIYCPYGQVGDQLWVRETFCEHTTGGVIYRADEKSLEGVYSYHKWRSSRFMPRTASRITLEILEIRAERVQDISSMNCIAEGIQADTWSIGRERMIPKSRFELTESYPHGFKHLWDSLNAKRSFSWEVNPWVWVISFATGVRLK